MMKIKIIHIMFCLLILAIPATIYGQGYHSKIGITNSSASLPVSGYPSLFQEIPHPGLAANLGKTIRLRPNYRIDSHIKLDGYYHQHIQTLIRMYPGIEYIRNVNASWSAFLGAGFGFGFGFEGSNAFTTDIHGNYIPKSALNFRPQWVGGIYFGTSYSFLKSFNKDLDLYLQFSSFLQGTFVATYVPFLPLNNMEIGVKIPFKKLNDD